MFRALQSSPKVVERLLRAFPTDRIDDRIEKDRFTAREVIAHLADWEMVCLDRFRLANSRPGSKAEPYDPGARASEHHFGDKDIFHEAEVYESRRGMTLDYLKALSEEDLNKTFVMGDGTTVSIRDYANYMLVHDMYHVDQLSSYFANEVATIS